MRTGMSWPTGRGRRQWISVGPAGAVALGVVWIAWVAVWLVLVAVYLAARGVWWVLSLPVAAWKTRQETTPAASA
jgi:hypothetical protein